MRLIDLPTGPVRGLGFAFLLLCLGAVLCALYSAGKPKTLRYQLVCVLLAFLSFWPEWIIEMYSVLSFGLTDYDFPVPAWAEPMLVLPVWLYAASAVLFAAAECALVVRLVRLSRRTLSAQSVCEGLDKLPDGICYSLSNGFPRLVNNRMMGISHAAFGEGVADARRLNRRMQAGELQPGCRLEEDEAGAFLLLPDETAWRLEQREITVNGEPLTETVAFDATQRHRALRELHRRNLQLEAANRRLRQYLNELDSAVREREVLEAKIRLHNKLGQCLLVIRGYLEDVDSTRRAVTDQLRQTVGLLQNDVPDSEPADRLEALLKAAKVIGVDVRIAGRIPPALKPVMEIAIHECLTNAVKHAQAHLLNVEITDGPTALEITVTNDGKPPKGPVQEAGGLSNLRVAAEQAGGTMEIESAPAFRLLLRFGAKAEHA